jgi:hypothetical protein
MSTGQNKTCIASSISWIALFLLSFISGTTTIPSSIKSSTLPQSSGGISTSMLLAAAKGKSSLKYRGVGTFSAWGENKSAGSHWGQCNKSFAISVHSSEARQNSLGHGEPPKTGKS